MTNSMGGVTLTILANTNDKKIIEDELKPYEGERNQLYYIADIKCKKINKTLKQECFNILKAWKENYIENLQKLRELIKDRSDDELLNHKVHMFEYYCRSVSYPDQVSRDWGLYVMDDTLYQLRTPDDLYQALSTCDYLFTVNAKV